MKISPFSTVAFAILASALAIDKTEASNGQSRSPLVNNRNGKINPFFRGTRPNHIQAKTHTQQLKQSRFTSKEHSLTISGGEVDNGYPDFIAPSFFLVFAGVMTYLIYELSDLNMPFTLGSKALSFTTGSLLWDNLVISLGSFFFDDAKTNPVRYGMLKALSYPRFTLHSVGTPLCVITVAEMGKAAGIPALQSKLVQTVIALGCIAVAVLDRLKFARGAGIDLATYDDSPEKALERDITRFTYKEPSFTYVIPAIVLALSNLVIGISARKYDKSIGNWLLFGAVSALAGNAAPGPIMTFTGNVGEVLMLFALVKVAAKVYV